MNSGSEGQLFGGDWAEQKLGILEEYLNAYTTALKNTKFRLVYIDAFAGSGKIELTRQNTEYSASLFQAEQAFRRFIDGSSVRAINVEKRPFDALVFVDTKSENIDHLAKLKQANPNREISIRRRDANEYLTNLKGIIYLITHEDRTTTIVRSIV